MRNLRAVLIIAFAVSAVAAQEADFYVAPAGRDTWTGRQAVPNGAGDDGPFATVDRARQAVRALKQAEPGRSRPIRVVLRGGVYELAGPLTFAPEDSGTAAAPVVYAAFPGETPVLSGGTRLTGWRVGDDGRWRVPLPAVQAGQWSFSQLFVDGQRRYRPRLPEEGYDYIAKELPPSAAAAGRGYDRLKFRAGDISAGWANLSDVEVLCFNHWNMHRLRLKEVDEERSVATFTGPTCAAQYWAALARGQRYLVENVKEALRRPGQWYLDRPTGELTYLAQPGESPDATVVVAPRLEQLVVVRGDARAGLPVAHLRFEGLTFAHSNWNTPPGGNSFPQAEANLGAAFSATGMSDCAVVDCTFRELGAWAIELAIGCSDNRIAGCVMTDLGAGGVKLGGQGIPGDEAEYTRATAVVDNTIAHGGRLHPAAVGIWLGHTPDNQLVRNDITDFYYTGISIGWQWAYAPSLAHDNLIADNHVWQIGQGVLSDMGGIYTLGPSEGTVIDHNCFHDIYSYTYGGWGIYFDQATTGIVAEDNLVYNTKTGGFHQHFGKDNIVRNNIFAFAKEAQLQRTRAEDHRSFTFERNLVYWHEGPLLSGRWNDEGFSADSNLYWSTDAQPIDFAGIDLAAWQARGLDVHTLVADPLFVDADGYDFRLRDGSPAAQIGFKPFPVTGFGRGTPGGEVALQPVPSAFPVMPPPPPPMPLDEDFEDAEPGAKAPAAQTYEDAQVTTATVRVTDELAASGRHCLKFTDQPGQTNVWDPHVYYTPGFSSGVVADTFDLRHETGAVLTHEWRDNSTPQYTVGPNLTVAADGTLAASRRELLKLPPGVWVHFEITCGLGDAADGKYTLRVRLPGQAPQEFQDLPSDPLCRRLTWWGFTSHANATTVYYLDNLYLGPVQPQ